MAKCKFCGRENPAGVNLCRNCGAKILDQDSPPAAEQLTSDRDDEQTDVKPDGLEGQLLAELKAGGKISAIKIYREQTGVGLKEAKDAVEALAEQHGIVVAASKSGCAGVLLLVLLACSTMVVML